MSVLTRIGRYLHFQLRGSDRFLVALSLLLQLGLGLFLGHAYDTRINMATGYLVATGQNPYIAQDLSAVFHNSSYQSITSIGYPPPWGLVLGLLYTLSYRLVPGFLFYNLAIKLPIIAANLCLAYLVRSTLSKFHVDQNTANFAWRFFLFNPFVLYATAAWGQIDSIVALFSLSSLVFLSGRKYALSALLLALSVSFKPTALPLVLAAFLFLRHSPSRLALRYFSVFMVAILLLVVAPFAVFGWNPAPILQHWNAPFTVGGGLTFFTLLEILKGSVQLGGFWWLAGLLWIPALIVAAFLLKDQAMNLTGLLRTAVLLLLVFFLFRSWVSEPNLLLLLPFLVILTATGKMDPRLLTAAWLVPLIFSFFNSASFQLLFPILPGLMDRLMHAPFTLSPLWWTLRTTAVFLWVAVAIWITLVLARPARLAPRMGEME